MDKHAHLVGINAQVFSYFRIAHLLHAPKPEGFGLTFWKYHQLFVNAAHQLV